MDVCSCCGSSANVDGGFNSNGEWVCVDCLFAGESDGTVSTSADTPWS